MSAPGITIRELESAADYAACVELQKQTWGAQFTDCVPPSILRVAQKIGGIAAGAFEGRDLVGFVFGLTGVQAGRIVHWSDMLAVRATERGRGIGEQLKRYQRDTLLARGIERVYWTFDPLDAKNAHVNFNRLGVFARDYVVDMYGETDSPLHTGIGTDRLIAVWELSSARVVARLAGKADTAQAPDGPRIQIPADIHSLNQAEPQRARDWRARTRVAFREYLPAYVVSGFQRAGAFGYYQLTSAENFTT